MIIGRVLALSSVYYGSLYYFKKQTIKFGELMFIGYGGIIRGAIAFALVMKIPYQGSENCANPEWCYTLEEYQLCVSTTIAVVMITTVLFGSFMKKASAILTGPAPSHAEVKAAEKQAEKKKEEELRRKSMVGGAKSVKSLGAKSGFSHYENLVHPNLEGTPGADVDENEMLSDGPKAFKDSNFVKWFSRIDA